MTEDGGIDFCDRDQARCALWEFWQSNRFTGKLVGICLDVDNILAAGCHPMSAIARGPEDVGIGPLHHDIGRVHIDLGTFDVIEVKIAHQGFRYMRRSGRQKCRWFVHCLCPTPSAEIASAIDNFIDRFNPIHCQNLARACDCPVASLGVQIDVNLRLAMHPAHFLDLGWEISKRDRAADHLTGCDVAGGQSIDAVLKIAQRPGHRKSQPNLLEGCNAGDDGIGRHAEACRHHVAIGTHQVDRLPQEANRSGGFET